MQYMRAHGNTPGPTQRPISAGAISAVIATIPAAVLLWLSGALNSLADALAINVPVVLVLYFISMGIAGGVYGRLFSRAANDRRAGWLFGISYGFLIWMLGPVTALQAIRHQPVAIGEAAFGLLGAHLLFGVALGLLFPSIHKLLQRRLGDLAWEASETKAIHGTKKDQFAAKEVKQ
jgi:hypothetical protein